MMDNGGTKTSCLAISRNRFSSEEIVFSNDSSLNVLNELLELSNQSRFDYCTMVTEIRNEQKADELRNKLLESCFTDQLKIIQSVLGRFTRRAEQLSDGKVFLKGRGVITSEGLIIVSKSITGLYQTEKKL